MKKLIKVLFCLFLIKNTNSQETIFNSKLISVKHDSIKKNTINYKPILFTGVSLNKNYDKSDLYLVGIKVNSNINKSKKKQRCQKKVGGFLASPIERHST